VLASDMPSDLAQRLGASAKAWSRSLIAGGVVVGVSGGVDSMVLLDLLSHFAREQGLRLTVAHAHHGLRGAAADGDAEMVQKVTARWGWDWVTTRLDVRGERERTAESMEMTARRLRHRFLARTAREVGARAVALAHHADDQVELFMLRLFRGAGGDGLGGMASQGTSPADPDICLLRPLLGVTKAELFDYAGAQGLEFREDASNQDPSIPRNHLRHTVLPWLREQVGAHLDRTVLRCAELVRADAECVEALANQWMRARRRRPFVRLPVGVQRAVIRQQLWDLGVPVDFEQVERLRLSESKQSVSTGRLVQRNVTGRIQVSESAGIFRDESRELPVLDRGRTEFSGVTLTWRKVAGGGRRAGSARAGVEQLDADAVGERVVLRHWRPGDRFQPLGMPRATKLQDLFINRKVPAALRRSRLLGTTLSGEIFWVEGLPPGERFKVSSTTRRRLVWSWQRLT